MFTEAKIKEVESLPLDINMNDIYTILQNNPNSYTHGMFKYPCKFIPEIPRWAIKKYAPELNSVIFDPFSGSGTTLLESVVNGHRAYGTEIDSLAKLIIRVKTSNMSSSEIIELEKTVERLLIFSDDETNIGVVPNIKNILHWFPEDTVSYLGRIRAFLDNIEDIKIKEFFQLVFATIIRNVSYADNQSPKPYVSSRIAKMPSNPKTEFVKIYNKYKEMLLELNENKCVEKAHILNGDALQIKDDIIVDLAITSPPYINAFDYARTLRLENLWLGFLTEESLLEKKKTYVGTESITKSLEEKDISVLEDSELLRVYFNKILKVDEKRAYVVKRFFEDMKKNLVEVQKILKVDGRYVIVIGDSVIRKVNIESWKVIRDIAIKMGYEYELSYSYNIVNPYLRIPRKGRGGEIKRDNVLVLRRS
ncbi:MAG: modification methylase [Clostridia bacterium]|nr:modification methylase [Clostridia bacterium]